MTVLSLLVLLYWYRYMDLYVLQNETGYACSLKGAATVLKPD